MTHTFPDSSSRLTYFQTMPQRNVHTRLLSPIRIPEGSSAPSPSSAISPSCSPIKRRRAHHNLFHQFAHTHPRSPAASSPTRQRHCKKPECCIVPSPLSATPFDDLPWISLLDHYPSPTIASPYEPTSPWDIADLPIPVVDAERAAEKRHSGGTGPIRSRKSTARLRCVPFPTIDATSVRTPPPLSAVPELSPSILVDDDAIDECELFLQVPMHIRARTWSGSSEDSEPPRTPPQRAAVLPALVDFRNLMPVSQSDDARYEEGSWSL